MTDKLLAAWKGGQKSLWDFCFLCADDSRSYSEIGALIGRDSESVRQYVLVTKLYGDISGVYSQREAEKLKDHLDTSFWRAAARVLYAQDARVSFAMIYESLVDCVVDGLSVRDFQARLSDLCGRPERNLLKLALKRLSEYRQALWHISDKMDASPAKRKAAVDAAAAIGMAYEAVQIYVEAE